MSEKCPSCGSCGMPMDNPELFGARNESNPYCKYCTNEGGELLPYETILEQNTDFYMEEQGIAREAAKEFSVKFLSTLPAWKAK